MTHNTRINQDAFYANAVPLPATWWQTLDTNLSKAINGDGGGTWNPSAPIVINGAGLGIAATWSVGGGAQLQTPAASGARVLHSDNDYILLIGGHTGSTRTLATPCGRLVDASQIDAAFGFNNPYDGASIGYGSDPSPANTSGAEPYRLLTPLRVHQGGTFTQAAFTFVVSTAHPSVPTSLPQFRVYKVDAFGNVTPLRTTSTLPNGFEPFPTPGSGAIWTNSSNPQTFTYTLDAGVVIDTSQFLYIAEIVDEMGTNALAGNIYLDVASTFTTIPDIRPQ